MSSHSNDDSNYNDDSDYDADLAAQLENGAFDSNSHKPYEVEAVQRITDLWKRFAKNLPSATPSSDPFQAAPPISHVKGYFKWRLNKGQGRIGEKMCVATLLKEFERLLRAVRYRGHRYKDADVTHVREFIKGLRRDGASTRTKDKPVALYVDVEEILRFLWCEDAYDWAHPRRMIQTTWLLLVSAFYGMRPGEVVESSAHCRSNEGILYKDVSLYLARQPDMSMKYLLKIGLRNRKNMRGVEGNQQVITLYEEEEPYIHACPVRWFLSLALADDVFRDKVDLDARYLRDTVQSTQIHIKKEKESLPILRAMSGNSVSPNRIWSAQDAGRVISALGRRAGYKETITPYSVRRGFASGIEGKTSAPKMRQLMGHSNDGVLQAYLSKNVGIDTQNAVRGLQQNTGRVDLARSVGFGRDTSAPLPWEGLIGIRPPYVPDKKLVTAISIRTRRAKIAYVKRKAAIRRSQLAEDEQDDDPGPSRALAKVVLEQFLRVNPARRQVKEVLWERKSTHDTFLLPALIAMAKPESFVVTDPNKGPVRNGKTYCFDCDEYVARSDLPYHERNEHQKPLDPLCEVLFWQNLLLRPGRCPFCLGTQDYYIELSVLSSARPTIKRFFTREGLLLHLESKHLDSLPNDGIECPHPFCKKSGSKLTRAEFAVHINSMHGIRLPDRYYE